jgi:hypothetical protein
VYRLLIINSYKSHCLFEFQEYCKENKIIALCMPAHASHLLQPLDLTCFSPMKRMYGDRISQLIVNRVNKINKEAFLPAFISIYKKAFSVDNIRAGFRAAGLVPYDPEAVLSKLDVRLRTPTPPAPEDTP